MDKAFSELAGRAFSFLGGLGFRVVQRESDWVRYASSSATVEIDWDPRSGEIGMWIGPRAGAADRKEMFSLTDLFGMLNVDVPERRAPLHAMEEQRLTSCLESLAAHTERFGQDALSGDPQLFQSLWKWRAAQAVARASHEDRLAVRAAADRAWRDQSFQRVVELLSSIEGDLTEAERKKLAYARERSIPKA